MSTKKSLAAFLLLLFWAAAGYCETLEDNWNDFLHYTKIGRPNLAAGYAEAIVQSDPEPVEMLSLSQANPEGYNILLRVRDTAADTELADIVGSILDIIEKGRFARKRDPEIIAAEIRRLSTTARGRVAAVKRLQNAGEYAIMYMLDALSDKSRQKEWPNIVWALPQIGRAAVRPLAAALQTQDTSVKVEIIRAMGKIRYPQSLAYLKYVAENSDSAELADLAAESIRQIDPAALKIPAARLFYRLGENYYYHAQSLKTADDADFANIWFWNPDEYRLRREMVSRKYFNELMAMRCCEWALKADAGFGKAIGLWLASYSKAEAAEPNMPAYFGTGHGTPAVYATTSGPEYLHQALARAIKDENAYVALSMVRALAATAGEKSLFSLSGTSQPLIDALQFGDNAVKYSAAIAIAQACPKKGFPESKLVVENLIQALTEPDEQIACYTTAAADGESENYALDSVKAMLKLAQTANPVIDLSVAGDSLINATRTASDEIKILAAKVLARFNSPDAQRAVAAMALKETGSIELRISAFNCLAISAKLNANLLDDEQIDAVYSLISSRETDSRLRSAAAIAYGALNLPSEKVKTLILDQASS